jgi:hypothetical protein
VFASRRWFRVAIILFLAWRTLRRSFSNDNNDYTNQDESAGSSPKSHHPTKKMACVNSKIILATFITLSAGILATVAWRDFTMATPAYPATGTTDYLLFTVPSQVKSARVQEYEGYLNGSTSEMFFNLNFRLNQPVSHCLPWRLTTYPNDIVKSLDGSPIRRVASFEQIFKACPGSVKRPILGAGFDVSFNTSPVRAKGYRISIALPSVGFLTSSNPRVGDGVAGVRLNDLMNFTVESQVSLPGPFRVDSGSPLVNGSSLSWTESGPDPAESSKVPTSPGPDANVTELTGEATANRLLFVAGIMGGLAGALIPWAGQLALDSRKQMRSERQ